MPEPELGQLKGLGIRVGVPDYIVLAGGVARRELSRYDSWAGERLGMLVSSLLDFAVFAVAQDVLQGIE